MGDYYFRLGGKEAFVTLLSLMNHVPNFIKTKYKMKLVIFDWKNKNVNYFDLEVIEVHNAINVDLAKTHVANVLANVELPNVRNGESFIALPSNSHGYSLCNNHKDEDLTLIEKGRAYRRIWQWKYKLC